MNVNIVIEGGHKYAPSVKDGREYTSVSYQGRNYGGGCPCDTSEEVAQAVAHAKTVIRSNGDVPHILDTRVSLSQWVS